MKKWLLLLALTVTMTLQGCATSRSVVNIPTIATDTTAARLASESVPALYIRDVTDAREFQQNPPSADIPSLGFGGANAATDDLKARAIGRKRNGWGKALGDVLLPENTTVEQLVRDTATAGFQEAGWRVVQAPNATQDMTTVDITIKQFWSWFQPGFWAVSTNARIDTEFDFSSPYRLAPVVTEYEDHMQFVTDSDWQNTIQQALAQYREKLAREAQPD